MGRSARQRDRAAGDGPERAWSRIRAISPSRSPRSSATLIAQGRERGYLTFEQIAAAARGGRGDQGAGRRAAHAPGRARRRRDRRGRRRRLQGAAERGRPRPAEEARARPDGRAEPRLAAALPALDRPGRAADRRAGGRAGEADRARRHGGQAADGRGQPAAGRLDREGLPGPRPELPRPDPGGVAGADPGGGEVRLPPRLQVLDLRDLVDPPGGDPGDRRQGAHDPDPRPHGREAEPGRPRRAPARPAAGPRARAGGDRRRAALVTVREVRDILRVAQMPVSLEKPVGRRGRVRAGRLRRRRRRGEPFETASENLQREDIAGRWTRCRSASAR